MDEKKEQGASMPDRASVARYIFLCATSLARSGDEFPIRRIYRPKSICICARSGEVARPDRANEQNFILSQIFENLVEYKTLHSRPIGRTFPMPSGEVAVCYLAKKREVFVRKNFDDARARSGGISRPYRANKHSLNSFTSCNPTQKTPTHN